MKIRALGIAIASLFLTSSLMAQTPSSNTSANIYSQMNQTILPNSTVKFEGINIQNSKINTSAAATTGAITFTSNAIYLVTYKLECHLTPPFPNPVPAFSFGLTLNNTLVPGSATGDYISSPDEIVRVITGSTIIKVNSGQTLRLINTSLNPVDLIADAYGSSVKLASASITFTAM